MRNNIEVIKTEEIFEGFIKIKEDTIKENGQISTRIVLDYRDAAAVLVVDGNEVLLVNQYRYPAGRYFDEIPAGLIDDGETPIEAAVREAGEELGVLIKDVEFVHSFYSMAGICRHKVHLFRAKVCGKMEKNLDVGEFVEEVRVPMDVFLKTKYEDIKTELSRLYLLHK